MHIYLVYQKDGSDKFWSAQTEGAEYTVTFGKTGTAGQAQTKVFETAQQAEKEAEKAAAAKRKKGYADAPVPPGFAAPPAPAKKAAAKPAPKSASSTAPLAGPPPAVDDGKKKPWHDEDWEEEFSPARMALAEVDEGDAPREGKKRTGLTLTQAQAEYKGYSIEAALAESCKDCRLDHARAFLRGIRQHPYTAKSEAKYLQNALHAVFGRYAHPQENVAQVVQWLLEEGAVPRDAPAKPDDDDEDDEEVMEGPFGLVLGNEIYAAYAKDPNPARVPQIFEEYFATAFEEAGEQLATLLRQYAAYVKTGETDEDDKFEYRPEAGRLDESFFGINLHTFSEYWVRVYLKTGGDEKSAFSFKTQRLSGLVTAFVPRYAHLLVPHLEQLAQEGVFADLFAGGSVTVTVENRPGMLLRWAANPGVEDAFDKTLERLLTTTSWQEDLDACLCACSQLLAGARGAEGEERAYALLRRFLYQSGNGKLEDTVHRFLYDFTDVYPRACYELAAFNNANFDFAFATELAHKALAAGYAPAADLLQQMAKEEGVRKRLAEAAATAQGEAPQPAPGYDLLAAKQAWKGKTFAEAFTEEDLYLKTENIIARARPDGNIYIRFLVEGEAGYGEALDFVNALLEKGYSQLSGGWSKGFALLVRFVQKPEYIPELKGKKGGGVSYPLTSCHAFFARAVHYPALREKVRAYAERALDLYTWYQDLMFEDNTVPGTFAVAALAFCGKEYFPLIGQYAAATDDEHTYIQKCLPPALAKHYAGDPDCGAIFFSLAVSGAMGGSRLPKDLIWSPGFMESFLTEGGAAPEDAARLEYFLIACEAVYGDEGKANLKKLKALAGAAQPQEKQVYTDFYNTYLAALQNDDDAYDKMKPLGGTAAAAAVVKGATLTEQEAVLTLEEAGQRGYAIDEVFEEKIMILAHPACITSYETIAHLRQQYNDIGRENGKRDSRRCHIMLHSGDGCIRFGEWAVNTPSIPCEVSLIVFDGKQKPMLLHGELNCLKLGIECTRRWPATPEDAEKLRQKHLLREAGPRKTDAAFLQADKYLDRGQFGDVFYSEWHGASAGYQLGQIPKDAPADAYLASRLMLAYLARRRGDAPALTALCRELEALQPGQAAHWQSVRAVVEPMA